MTKYKFIKYSIFLKCKEQYVNFQTITISCLQYISYTTLLGHCISVSQPSGTLLFPGEKIPVVIMHKNKKKKQVLFYIQTFALSVSFMYGSAHSVMSPCCSTFSNFTTKHTSLDGYVTEKMQDFASVDISGFPLI